MPESQREVRVSPLSAVIHQTKLLFWKIWLVKMKNPIGFLLQIAAPPLLFLFFAWMKAQLPTFPIPGSKFASRTSSQSPR